jgi:hypothetical protein
MNIHEFTQRVLKPIGIELFPASGNLYFKHWRIGYVHTNKGSAVQFVTFPKITPVPGLDETILQNYKNASAELKARVVLHDIPIKDRHIP